MGISYIHFRLTASSGKSRASTWSKPNVSWCGVNCQHLVQAYEVGKQSPADVKVLVTDYVVGTLLLRCYKDHLIYEKGVNRISFS